MKNNYSLKTPVLNPKKSTVNFLLNFSKSIAVLNSNQKKFIISKNYKPLILLKFVPYEKHKAHFF